MTLRPWFRALRFAHQDLQTARFQRPSNEMGKSNMDISALTPEAQPRDGSPGGRGCEDRGRDGQRTSPGKVPSSATWQQRRPLPPPAITTWPDWTEHLVQASAVSLLVASLTL